MDKVCGVKVGGLYKDIDGVSAKVDGEYKQGDSLFVRINDMWQEVWSGVRVPIGIIVAWNGPIEEIPDGWYLCNGENGTPNLIDRFIMGTTQAEKMNLTYDGGTHTHSVYSAGSHTHTVSSSSHKHDVDMSADGYGPNANGDYYTDYAMNHSHDISSSGGSHTHTVIAEKPLPSYYKLAFIMKGVEK